MATYRIFIKGTVQGVGFRPFIYQLAMRYDLCGTVLNDTQGVEIFINATSETLRMFLDSVSAELPPLASIESIETAKTEPKTFTDFSIVTSDTDGNKTVRIPPDVSICKECEKELFDPLNRRYEYPFITCTHCGVRYSIVYDLPYDRKNTSMKFFKMCEACRREYTDPLNRRYHAQPIGCHECGPSLLLLDSAGQNIPTETIIDDAARVLLNGAILAVKGVGGYHLMCDATDEGAVARLRKRKHRPAKPFAVMVKDIVMAKELAHIGRSEEILLSSKERPIVLLNSTRNDILAASIAPGISRIGLFLPYTPLHLLLLNRLGRPLVATSANVTDEPICTDTESLKKLQNVYDYIQRFYYE
jgi:hydrogenase maturation protein HypF